MTPEVASVEHVARLRLCLRRAGYELRLANVSEELRLGLKLAGCELCLANVSEELRIVIDLAGLAGRLGVEVEWQAEKRE